jgi:hypothetical protein
MIWAIGMSGMLLITFVSILITCWTERKNETSESYK